MSVDSAARRSSLPEAKPERRLFSIETFSLGYDAMEDRLRLDATDKAGRVQGIWLTQKLTNKLVVALARDLDRDLAAGPVDEETGNLGPEQDPSSPASPEVPEPAVAAALHGMAQQRLRLARAETSSQNRGARSSRPPAVRAAPANARWLCTTIQLRPRPGGIIVSFTDDVRITARFFMSHANTRVVLDGLASRYRAADWPLKAFPDWVQDAGDLSEGLGQGRVLN